jgi:hypothetical protein
VTSATDFRITALEVLGYIGCETGICGGLGANLNGVAIRPVQGLGLARMKDQKRDSSGGYVPQRTCTHNYISIKTTADSASSSPDHLCGQARGAQRVHVSSCGIVHLSSTYIIRQGSLLDSRKRAT